MQEDPDQAEKEDDKASTGGISSLDFNFLSDFENNADVLETTEPANEGTSTLEPPSAFVEMNRDLANWQDFSLSAFKQWSVPHKNSSIPQREPSHVPFFIQSPGEFPSDDSVGDRSSCVFILRANMWCKTAKSCRLPSSPNSSMRYEVRSHIKRAFG